MQSNASQPKTIGTRKIVIDGRDQTKSKTLYYQNLDVRKTVLPTTTMTTFEPHNVEGRIVREYDNA